VRSGAVPIEAALRNSGGPLLKLDPHNANRGTDRGRRAVADSLAECGAGRSILVDRDVIVRRWEEFTGRKAVLDGDEGHTQSS